MPKVGSEPRENGLHPGRRPEPRYVSFQWWRIWRVKSPFPLLTQLESPSKLWSQGNQHCALVFAVQWRQYARYDFFQAEGHTQWIPSLSLNMCQDKRHLTNGQPALFLDYSHCFALSKPAFSRGSLLQDLCSEVTKKQSPCSSSCGLHNEALLQSPLWWGKHPCLPTFLMWSQSNYPVSSAASLFKKCYQLPPFKTNQAKSTLWNISDLLKVLADEWKFPNQTCHYWNAFLQERAWTITPYQVWSLLQTQGPTDKWISCYAAKDSPGFSVWHILKN